MKKIFMLLSIVLVGNMLINSCIYDKVCEGESSIITPPEKPDTVIHKDTIDRTFRLRIYSTSIESVNTYAYVNMATNPPTIFWESSDLYCGFFLRGERNLSLLDNSKEFLYSTGSTEATNVITKKTYCEKGVGFAYYPYKESVSGTTLNSTLNYIQNQSSLDTLMADSLSRNMLMITAPSDSFLINTGDCNLYMNNVFALINLRVKKDLSYTMNERVKSVKLYIGKENNLSVPLNYILAGDYSIDLSKAPGTYSYEGPKFTSAKNQITAEITAGNNISNEDRFVSMWFVINPVVINADERLVVNIETNTGSLIGVPFSITSIKRNNIYRLVAEANSSNTVSSGYTEEDFVNKPANCFIVSRRGRFQIDAKTAAGNVVKGEKVEWLWASIEEGHDNFSIEDLIDPENIDYDKEKNTITFKICSSKTFSPFHKGNVILALKDASGNIVWTWHIWITDKPEDKTYDNGSVFMDRNLGALSSDINNSPAVDTYGFVYQWGRKDPFYGGDGVIYDEAEGILTTARMHTIVNTSYTWNSVEKAFGGNLDYSIKNPMSFIYNEGSGSSWKNDPADWLSTSNSSLWSTTSKTDYDPCPDGYRVPNKDEFNILHVANVTNAFNKDSEKYWKYNSSSVSYWPAAGMRQGRQNLSSGIYGTQLKYSGTNMLEGQCYYWTSSPFSVGGTPLLGASYRIHTVSNLLYSADDYGDNADAYPIRCVKE